LWADSLEDAKQGLAAQKRADYPSARFFFARAIQNGSTLTAADLELAYVKLAEVDVQLGNLDAASTEVQSALKINSGDPEAVHVLTQIQGKQPPDKITNLRCTLTPDPAATKTPVQAQILENYEGGSSRPEETNYDLNYTKLTAKDELRGLVPLSVSDTNVYFRLGAGTASVTDVSIDRVSGEITETTNPDDASKQIVFSGRCVIRTVAF
jgi:hypothetical protein